MTCAATRCHTSAYKAADHRSNQETRLTQRRRLRRTRCEASRSKLPSDLHGIVRCPSDSVPNSLEIRRPHRQRETRHRLQVKGTDGRSTDLRYSHQSCVRHRSSLSSSQSSVRTRIRVTAKRWPGRRPASATRATKVGVVEANHCLVSSGGTAGCQALGERAHCAHRHAQ